MLKKEICRQCFLRDLVDSEWYNKQFDKHWEQDEVPCIHSGTGHFEMIATNSDVPKDCPFDLEQVLQ